LFILPPVKLLNCHYAFFMDLHDFNLPLSIGLKQTVSLIINFEQIWQADDRKMKFFGCCDERQLVIAGR